MSCFHNKKSILEWELLYEKFLFEMSSDYIAMQTPKRGLKNMADPVYDGPEFKRLSTGNEFYDLFWTVVLGPFKSASLILSGELFFTMILVFLGSFLNGAVFVMAQSAMNAAATDIVLRSFVLGLIAASVYYATSTWSYYDKFPTVIYPAQALAMTGMAFTRKKEETFGFFTAIVYCVFQFAGYLAAGGALRAFAIINTTLPLYNVSSADQGYWIYWFGGTVITFSFLFNRLFRQSPGETGGADTATRSNIAAALAIFFMTIGFYSLGIKSYSSGLFVTQVLAYPALPDTALTVNGVVPWAFYTFVDLFAVSATVVLLVILLALVQYAMSSRKGGSKKTYEPDMEAAPVQASMSATSERLKNRKIAVNY